MENKIGGNKPVKLIELQIRNLDVSMKRVLQ